MTKQTNLTLIRKTKMKKIIVIAIGLTWLTVLSVGMSKTFAWETCNEKTAVNSDYNKAQSNPSNYHRNEGYGLTSTN
jgi:hypothetical protein